jgi:hypothetical protein
MSTSYPLWLRNIHRTSSIILEVHGEMEKLLPIQPLVTCINGTVSQIHDFRVLFYTSIANKELVLVWHGSQEKYQIFGTIGGRFNSEFGMEAFPHLETIEYFVEDKNDLFPQSCVIDFHNKADGHERRLATYLVENLRTATDLEVMNSISLFFISITSECDLNTNYLL